MGVTVLGGPALMLAAGIACASAVVSWDGQRRGRPASVTWGRRGLVAVFGLVSVGLVALGWALVGHNYSLVYVADHASRDTTWPYRLAGMWGGMSGSLLLWTWMLVGWALVASGSLRRRLPELAGCTQAALALEMAVFLGLLATVARPFATLAVPAIDGGGFTPILRHPAMLYHPPLLYLGYVGLAVPAAVALAALAARTTGDWLAVARRFMLPSLVLLAVGMAAGAHWAYVELGWGGYWAWDPVENGALLPFLAGIAFVHSAVVARRPTAPSTGGGSAVAGLAFLAFGLSLLGAFMTRSGVTASVHAFAEARAVGWVLLVVLVVASAGMAGLLMARRRRSAAAPAPVAALTTEGAVRANNALLLAVIVVVGFGVLYPVLVSDDLVVTGRYFAIVTAPLALGVLAVIGVGPRLGWRPRPWPEIRSRLRPAWWGIAALVAAAIGLHDRRPVPLMMFGLAGSAAALTVAEWRSRRRPSGGSGTPVPRLGGLLAHLGVAVLLAGVAGTATGTQRSVSLVPGQEVTVRGNRLRLESVAPVPAPDGGRAAQATFTVRRGDHHIATLRPIALVAASGDRVSEAALRSTPVGDLQVALRTVSSGGGAVVVEIFVVPLAQWVWWGALLVAAGIAMSIGPRARRSSSPAPPPAAAPPDLAAVPGGA